VLTVNALLALCKRLHEVHEFMFVLTSSLNQYAVENHISVIQGRESFQDNPNPPAFGATYWQVIVQHLLDVPKDANCRDDLATFLLELQDVNRCHPSTIVTLDGVSRTAGFTADDPSHHTVLPEECLNALCAVCFTVARNRRTYMYVQNFMCSDFLLEQTDQSLCGRLAAFIAQCSVEAKTSLFAARNCRNYIYITKTLSDILLPGVLLCDTLVSRGNYIQLHCNLG